MNTVASLVLRCLDAPRGADQSLQAISLLSCAGLVMSLALMAFGIDLGNSWI
jgi:hypothetical protein